MEFDGLSGLEKRVRSKKFTVEEQNMLCKIIEPYISVIDCRKSDVSTVQQKQAAWSEIAGVYNANNYMSRSVENLQNCFKNMKAKLKRDRELSEAKPVTEETMKQETFMNTDGDWSEDETLPAVDRTVSHPVDDKTAARDGDAESVNNNFKPVLPLEILNKKSEPVENGPTKRKKRSIDDANIMRDVAKKKRELLNLQQAIATEQLREIQMCVALRELEIEHKRSIHKLELEERNMQRQHMEQKQQLELSLLQLQIKQFENK